MSRNSQRGRTKPNSHQNAVIEEGAFLKNKAQEAKAQNDKWERKQQFVVLRPDHKTVIYRHVKKVKNLVGKEIHKGKI